MKKQTGFQRNWLVRAYDKTGFCIDSWKIEDRFEWEASREAEADIVRDSRIDDWTMTPVNAKIFK